MLQADGINAFFETNSSITAGEFKLAGDRFSCSEALIYVIALILVWEWVGVKYSYKEGIVSFR